MPNPYISLENLISLVGVSLKVQTQRYLDDPENVGYGQITALATTLNALLNYDAWAGQ
jgi:hypothetical protein